MKESQDLADKLVEKKTVIETALNDLDNKVEKSGVSSEHLRGMVVIEELFTEFDTIQLEQDKVNEQIRKA